MSWCDKHRKDTLISSGDEYGRMVCIENIMVREPWYASRSRLIQSLVKDYGLGFRDAKGWFDGLARRGVIKAVDGTIRHYPTVYAKGPKWHEAIAQACKATE